MKIIWIIGIIIATACGGVSFTAVDTLARAKFEQGNNNGER